MKTLIKPVVAQPSQAADMRQAWPLLGLLTLANRVFHLSPLKYLDVPPVPALHAALALIML
jgi:hypothetical protein